MGELVGSGSPTKLATILQLDPVWINASISEADPRRARAVMAAKGKTVRDFGAVPVEAALAGESGFPHHGTLDYVAPMVDPSTGTLAVRGPFDNAKYALLPGYFVRLRIPVATDAPVLLLPDDAIASDQGTPMVFIVDAGGGQRQQAVQLGGSKDGMRVVDAGITPEDRVVASSTIQIEPGAHVRAVEAPSRLPASATPTMPPASAMPTMPPATAMPTASVTPAKPWARRAEDVMLSRFFIARPVLANVLAILTVLVGVFAMLRLLVAQYPNVVPPTVQVTTRYPGASPADVMRPVALPVEQQVNGVQSMLSMQSTSAADGTYALTVTFAIGTDLDQAQVLVQNRVQSAVASLPQAVQAQGVTVQKRSTAVLQIIALTSTDARHDSLYLSNYAIINMRDVLARVPGVGSINVFGAGQYAMRVWLDPERLRARGLTVQDVTQNLQQQNMDVTAGQLGMSPAPEDQAR